MLVKELIERLQKCKQDANVVVCGNGKGASPFIDIDEDGQEVYETEDCEPFDRNSIHSIVHKSTDDDGEEHEYRNVVVLFGSHELY